MGDGVSFSFNKGNKFNITTSDGVSKEELIQRAGGENTQQGKLISSIFARYDNGDGFLSADEYQAMQADLVGFAKDDNLGGRELKKFNSNLSTEGNAVEGNAYSMEDLQAVISMMVDGSDSVTGVVQDGDNLKVTYKPEEGVGTRTSTFAKGDNNELTLLSDSVVNVDTITVTEYVNGDKTKKSKTVETVTNGFTTTTIYGDDGTTPASIVKVKGIETYQMDPEHPERPLEYVKNRQPQKETVKYTYNNEGSVETTYLGDSNKPSKVVTKDAQGAVVSTTEYTYDGDITTETTTIDGQEPVVVRKDRDGQVIPETTTYDVKPGEVWYNIVAAKYGVSDHKTIMNIVHQLKDIAGIDYRTNNANDKKMPSQITLPNEVTVDGQKFTLNAEAAANPALVRTTPPPPPADEVVEEEAQIVAEDTPQVVEQDQNPPSTWSNAFVPNIAASDLLLSITEPKKDLFDREILRHNSDGTYTGITYKNDFIGTDTTISREATYNNQGVLTGYTDYEYGNQGNKTREIVRNNIGIVIKYRNADGIWRNANGTSQE